MEEIKSWLNSEREYNSGLILYNKYGHSEALKRMLGWKYTEYNHSKLIEALEGLFKSLQPVQAQSLGPEEKIQQKASNEEKQATVPQPADRAGSVADLSWKPLYKQAVHIHSQLIHLPTDKDRFLAAANILETFEKIDRIWKQNDYRKKYGKLPEEQKLSEEAKLEIFKQIKRLSVQISKHRNNTARATEVEAWLQEKDRLKNLLNGNS